MDDGDKKLDELLKEVAKEDNRDLRPEFYATRTERVMERMKELDDGDEKLDNVFKEIAKEGNQDLSPEFYATRTDRVVKRMNEDVDGFFMQRLAESEEKVENILEFMHIEETLKDLIRRTAAEEGIELSPELCNQIKEMFEDGKQIPESSGLDREGYIYQIRVMAAKEGVNLSPELGEKIIAGFGVWKQVQRTRKFMGLDRRDYKQQLLEMSDSQTEKQIREVIDTLAGVHANYPVANELLIEEFHSGITYDRYQVALEDAAKRAAERDAKDPKITIAEEELSPIDKDYFRGIDYKPSDLANIMIEKLRPRRFARFSQLENQDKENVNSEDRDPDGRAPGHL